MCYTNKTIDTINQPSINHYNPLYVYIYTIISIIYYWVNYEPYNQTCKTIYYPYNPYYPYNVSLNTYLATRNPPLFRTWMKHPTGVPAIFLPPPCLKSWLKTSVKLQLQRRGDLRSLTVCKVENGHC